MRKNPPCAKIALLLCGVFFCAPAWAQADAPRAGDDRETVTVTGTQTRNAPADPVIFDPETSHAGAVLSDEIADEDSHTAFTTIAEGLRGELGNWYAWQGIHGRGSIRPTSQFTSRNRLCRGFTMIVNEKTVLGTACAEADGWHIR